MGRVREEKRTEEKKRRSAKRRSQKKEDKKEDRKSRNTCVFPMICGAGGSKSRLPKAAGAELSGQIRNKKLHVVVARSTFASEKKKKKTHVRNIFGC